MSDKPGSAAPHAVIHRRRRIECWQLSQLSVCHCRKHSTRRSMQRLQQAQSDFVRCDLACVLHYSNR